jgi:site-specific recombinase XerD
MLGAPGKVIHELAGHSDFGATQRYMYLSPESLEMAMQLLG